MTEFKASPENHAAITALVDKLQGLPVGGTITYRTLSDVIGVDVQDGGRNLLNRARKIVETETDARLACVTGVGIKRLPLEEIIGIGQQARRHIRRTARIAHARLTGIKANDITDDQRRKLNAEAAIFGAISVMSKEATVKKVEGAPVDQAPTFGSIIDILSKKSE